MNEFYIEQFVKKKTTKQDTAIPILTLILGSVMLIQYGVLNHVVTNFSLLMIILSLITVILSVVRLRSLDAEYEYLCTNGDFDFDKVIRKSKRKHLFSVDGDDVVVMAPIDAQEVAQYRGVKSYDLTSIDTESKVYKIVAKQGENMIAITFSPNKEMVEKMWTRFPRNVVK